MAEPTPEHTGAIAEISHGPSAFEQFLDKNQKLMIGVALGIAVAAGGWVVYDGMKEGERLAGGQALVSAEDLSSLEAVVKEHAGTPAAPSAAVLLSDEQWDQGQQSAAIETLRGEIDANPDHPASIPARARLGTRLLQQGDTDGARAAFQQIIDNPEASYFAPYALFSLSEIDRQAGEIDLAKARLEQSSENYIGNPLNQISGQAARFVAFEMPEEIDPPEPEPTTEVSMDPDMPPVPDIDLSTPVELDPTAPTSGGSGNPLLDNLSGDGTDRAPEMPAAEDGDAPEESPQDTPELSGDEVGEDPAEPSPEAGE